MRQAQALDPLAPRITVDVTGALMRRGQYDSAVEELTRILELQPNFQFAHIHLGHSHFRKGLNDDALASLKRSMELYPDETIGRSHLAYFLAMTGKREEALEILEEIQESKTDPGTLAMVYVSLGEIDKAFE